MDLELVERLIRMLESSDLEQLEVEEKGFRVRLQKPGAFPVATPATVVPAATSPAVPLTSPPAAENAAPADTVPIEAPMVGTFYRAPAPDAPPYVEVGDTVSEETIVCIVEAMKVMNEIKAGLRGTVVGVPVENAQPVEFGQPLFLVKPSGV